MNIIRNYNHSKIGNILFSICTKWTKFIIKHRVLYYFLMCTWALPLVLFGLVCSLALFIAKIFGANITFKRCGWVYQIRVGRDYWGGFECGLCYIRDQKSVESLDEHEFGHSIAQMSLFGVFSIFLVAIPSVVRFWYRYFKYERKGIICPKNYSAIWFEDSADCCGKYAMEYLRANKK